MQDPMNVPGGTPIRVRICPGGDLEIKPDYFFPTNNTRTERLINAISKDKRWQKDEITALHRYFLEREQDLILTCRDIKINNDFDRADVDAMIAEAAYFRLWAQRLLKKCEGKV